MPQYPKPPGHATRPPGAGARHIPHDARVDEVPPLGGVWSDKVRAWWATVWESPVATQWQPQDRFVLERLAWLLEMIETGSARGFHYSEARELEDRLGLSATGRRRLQWVIVQAPDQAEPQPVTAEAKTKRWLRALDGGDRGLDAPPL